MADDSDVKDAKARARANAILEAEVRRVLNALSPYGVLREDALARACGAQRWRAGEFRCALDSGVRAGRLRRLPFGFYASRGNTPPDVQMPT